MESAVISRLVALGRRPWRIDPASSDVRIIDADGRPILILPAGDMKAREAAAAILDAVNVDAKAQPGASFDPSI
jgi:hypothetical protein